MLSVLSGCWKHLHTYLGIYIFTHWYAATWKKKTWIWKREEGSSTWEGLEGGKGVGKMIYLYYNLKKHFYKKKRKLMVKKFQLTVKRFHPKWDWEWAVFKLMCFYLLSVWCDVCGHGAGVTGRGKFCGVISRLPHLHKFPELNVVHQAWASAVLPWWLLLNMSPDEFLEVRERDYRWASQTLECTQIIRNDTL